MSRAMIPSVEVFQGSDARLQNRLVTTAQAVLDRDDITSWSARVYDMSRGTLIKKLVDGSQDVSSNFFATLQTGNGWSRDSTGYNFEYVVDGDAFKTEGGKQYRIEFNAVTADENVKWAWVLKVQPWMGPT